MTNKEKKEKYANLMVKLDKATKNEYYYEAIFISYAILEDRTESLLRHAQIKTINQKGQALKLSEKLRKIKDNPKFQDKYIKKHFPNDLIEKILEWKRNRDKLIHNLINIKYEENTTIKDIALSGECLVKKVNNKTTLINKYLEQIIIKENY